MTNRKTKAALLAASLSLGAWAGGAQAAGFALKEQSATAQGNAFAGATAGAEDLSYMFFNPATIGRLDGYGAMAVASAVMPHSKVKDATATAATGLPIAGRADLGDVGKNALVPAFYAMAELSPAFRLGLGVNVPFGLETDYPDDWAGRYQATNSEVRTVNVNPVVAATVLPGLTLAAGLQAQYVEAKLSNRIDLNTISLANGGPAVPVDGDVEVQGDDWSLGYNVGVLYEYSPEGRVGLAYRSGIDHTLKGDADFTIPAAVAPAFGPLFADTGDSASVDLPPTVSAGIRQAVGHGVDLMGEVAWTGWSSFDDLVIEFDNPAQPDSVTTENWDDAWFAAVGASYAFNDQVTLRAGVAYDQSPVPDGTRTPRIPDGDRYWLSLGVGYQPLKNVGLDLSYTHIFVEDTDVSLTAAGENAARGSLDASYENSIDLVAVSVQVQF
ncbi:MAG: outer membrane protein transport protein [Geminicoccaceae bacterium]|nr:outer membrane protein transport protein [Geminicoccaceae bacterium]